VVTRVLRVASFLAPNALPAHQAAVDYLARRLERPVRLVASPDPEDLVRGQIELAFLCGLPYVRLTARWPGSITAIAAPVLRGARYAGRPVYFSDLIVRRHDAALRVDDLTGRPVAVNGRDSFSGWWALRGPIPVRAWENLATVETGSHEASITAGCEGAADWAAIDSQVLAVAVRNNPRLAARLLVVGSIGPAPAPPVAISLRLPQQLREQVLEAVRACAGDRTARHGLLQGGIERFVPVSDEHYDPIRRAAHIEPQGVSPV
jgi:phosphonate transport system substrate-binding protein